MPLPLPINANQTDAKSPIDQNLMDSIRLDLDYLESQISGGSVLFTFNLNGQLARLKNYSKAVDEAINFTEFSPSSVRAVLKRSGSGGKTVFDIRKVTSPKTPIIGIDHQFDDQTQQINQVTPNLSTQSITQATPQIDTQSIQFFKSEIDITSVVDLGDGLARYNLSAAIDDDYKAGASIRISDFVNSGNNGDFVIEYVNDSGYDSIVVQNAGATNEVVAAKGQLLLFEYSFLNPIDGQFVAGEKAEFALHTNANNNGQLKIYKTNETNNNILVYNASGVEQAGVAGTVDVLRWSYNFLGTVPQPDFTVGESIDSSGHSSGGNNGSFPIRVIELGGSNNIVVYNESGALQGGAAGTVNTNRWIYSYTVDPSSNVTAGDEVSFEGHGVSGNNGIFEIKQVNRVTTDNLVIFNEAGFPQPAAGGAARHTHKVVKFGADESASFKIEDLPNNNASLVEISGAFYDDYNESEFKKPFKVLEINRGGGANYNIVIKVDGADSYDFPMGYIQTEQRSIFLARQEINPDLTAQTPNQAVAYQNTNFVNEPVEANTPTMLFIDDVHDGAPLDLSVILS